MEERVMTPQVPNEALALGGAAASSLTEGTIIRAALMAERLGSLLDVAASPEVGELLTQLRQSAPVLTKTLQRLEALNQTGALDTLLDLAEMVQAAKVSMSDVMIARMANAGQVAMELMDGLMASGVAERVPALMQATIEARDEAVADKHFVSPLEVLKLPKEPELQFMFKFMIALARRLPKAVQG